MLVSMSDTSYEILIIKSSDNGLCFKDLVLNSSFICPI